MNLGGGGALETTCVLSSSGPSVFRIRQFRLHLDRQLRLVQARCNLGLSLPSTDDPDGLNTHVIFQGKEEQHEPRIKLPQVKKKVLKG